MTEAEGPSENQETSSVRWQTNDIALTTDFSRSIGCPNKSAKFNFVINAPFIQKVLICLFQYKVHILRLTVEHNLRQMSSKTLLSRGGKQCARIESCALVGTSHTWTLPQTVLDEFCCFNYRQFECRLSCVAGRKPNKILYIAEHSYCVRTLSKEGNHRDISSQRREIPCNT